MSKILDNSYYDLMISTALAPTYDTGDNITYLNRQNSLLHIPAGNGDPCDLGKHSYSSFPTLYTLASTISLENRELLRYRQIPIWLYTGRGYCSGH